MSHHDVRVKLPDEILFYSDQFTQMLGLAIQIEKPTLEARLNELTSSVEEMKIKLDSIEQSLLQVNY